MYLTHHVKKIVEVPTCAKRGLNNTQSQPPSAVTCWREQERAMNRAEDAVLMTQLLDDAGRQLGGKDLPCSSRTFSKT